MNNPFRSRNSYERELERSEKHQAKTLKYRRRILKNAKAPIVPYYCKVLQICMFGLPVLDALLEAVIWIQGKVSMTFPMYLLRVTWSVFMIWIFFAAILAGISIIQLYRVTYKGYEELEYRFADEIESSADISEYKVVDGSEDDPEMTLYARPAKITAWERYSRYIKICAVGTLVLGVLYGITELLV